MIDQEYTGKNLYQYTTQNERRDYVIPVGIAHPTKFSKEDFILKLDRVCDRIYDHTYTFSFSFHGDFLKNSHPHSSFDRLAQDLILRHLHSIISKIYSARQTNRQNIVRYLKDFLMQHCTIKGQPIFMLRLDIRKFYPSINKDSIMTRLRESSLLSNESLFLLDGILRHSPAGLPMGISVSASLSEYAMEKFDKIILRTSGVLYYKRYVDDIIVICSSQVIADKLWDDIPNMLKKFSLSINHNKSKRISFCSQIPISGYNHNEMTYLGYTFRFDGSLVTVHISDRKIREIKRRVIASLINWNKTHDFRLLEDRLRFLTGNCRFINCYDSIPTYSGIKHNYIHITQSGEEILYELDRFMQGLINSKNSSLGSSLSPHHKQHLSKYTFSGGYHNDIIHRFSPERIGQINRIW
ncbi:MAG: RNA-directed DNA polymerase [Muribaculaceae bacterium]|nr:RNA-directed DNA polymerase [Muribaculaceae bacterium]